MNNATDEEQETLLKAFYEKNGVSSESQSRLNHMTNAELRLALVVTAKDFLRAKQLIRLAKYIMLAMLGMQIAVLIAIWI